MVCKGVVQVLRGVVRGFESLARGLFEACKGLEGVYSWFMRACFKQPVLLWMGHTLAEL